ncbi:SCO6880 family protein [Nocardia aurantia]|uniref:Type VII secretion protein EccE n=1 Tax=Nocardia aurantia TaxID=2585199 RepID=A0A7K0DT13_9NOCA|nr:SCO6880 family protein [Nocardia aurantia]MQY28909.1 hypothetical protein [Nocardia aurantia]
MTGPRTSILGGEIARRSWLGLSRPVLMTWVAAVGGALTIYVLGSGATWAILAALAELLAVFVTTMEWRDRPSMAARRAHALRTWTRRRRGEHIYRNSEDAGYGDPAHDPGWMLPPPLGNTDPLDLSGTGLDDMFILRSANPGERPCFTVTLAVEGVADGLRSDAAYTASQAEFGVFLAQLARSGSHIRGVQLLHRSVPHDMTGHVRWAERRIGNLTDPRLVPAVESYGALVDVTAPLAEEHRSFVVLRIPQTEALIADSTRLARTRNVPAVAAIAQVVRDETERAVRLLVLAEMGRVDVLGHRRLAGVLRSFLDPTHPIDAHQDTAWDTCWPSYLGGADHVAVGPDGRWRTRVGYLRPQAIEPIPLGPLWLAPLLTGVDADPGDEVTPPAPTIRTVAVRIDFVPAHRARAAARGDHTSDLARRAKDLQKGRLDDGSADVLATASDRRRHDLMPGSGHHGAIYTATIAVTGRDPDDLERACLRVTEAAHDSAITDIDWATDDHDVAVFATLPLGRGLAVTPHTR